MDSFRQALYQQFAAAITMLENAIRACPDALWDDRKQWAPFWQIVHHTVYYLDLYFTEFDEILTTSPKNNGSDHRLETKPDRIRSKSELLKHLSQARGRCFCGLDSLTESHLAKPTAFEWQSFNQANLILDNLRHVQHHVGQLVLILRREADLESEWFE
jgi:hypothetical protein